MAWFKRVDGVRQINQLAKEQTPFLFVTSFDREDIFAQPLHRLDRDILYRVGDWSNYHKDEQITKFSFSKSPIDFTTYNRAFDEIIEEIRLGNTYLLNLTFETPIETNLKLDEIFNSAKAKFKLYFKGEFICFSPECFVEIDNDYIATYPMKGTIDANLPNAKEQILSNKKEMAEHIMIVDLMRNDLGIIASEVNVEKFRYVEKIEAGKKELLQVSSKITAKLPSNWQENLGTLLFKLLPAGSICGTPKKSTLNIIKRVENYERGFYTGIFGIFNGKQLRSAVMIRFIEKRDGKLFYKSGGGITIDSNAQSEYNELIDKVYLPF